MAGIYCRHVDAVIASSACRPDAVILSSVFVLSVMLHIIQKTNSGIVCLISLAWQSVYKVVVNRPVGFGRVKVYLRTEQRSYVGYKFAVVHLTVHV